MAVDMFMKLEGITGESKDHTHKGEIDVLAWSWGMSNPGSTHVGGGGGAGKVNVQDLSFTKYVDLATAPLMLAVAGGKHVKSATLVVRKAGEDPLEYITMVMTDCLVSAISTGGSGGEDRLTENVSLNFAHVEVTYKEQASSGKAGGKGDFKWDIKANVSK
jgi:type VI secretion system secreted protein Hcp